LLLITTGNIANTALFALFAQNMPFILMNFEINNLIEMNNEEIIIHE
jgi:predicted nuclease of predicted toxin-antitoxin system